MPNRTSALALIEARPQKLVPGALQRANSARIGEISGGPKSEPGSRKRRRRATPIDSDTTDPAIVFSRYFCGQQFGTTSVLSLRVENVACFSMGFPCLMRQNPCF